MLAAGFGTRMRPLTHDLPKPLMPVWNVPVIEHTLAMLRRWGVRDVLVNLHHRADRLFEYLRERPADGLRIALSFEPAILGTGGALRKAEWFLRGGPCWVTNADVVCDLDPGALLRAYRPRRTMAVLWMQEERGPRTVEMARGRITDFRSRRPGTPGTYTFTGLQLLNPALLRHDRPFLPVEPVFGSSITAYERALADGWTVAGVCVPRSYWADVGTPQQYLQCHRELLEARRKGRPGTRLLAGVRVGSASGRGFAAVSPRASVHPDAVLRDAVVWEGAVVEAGARLEQAVVGRDTRVRGLVRGVAMPAVTALDAAECGALSALGWKPEVCTALPLGPRGSARTFTRVRQAGRDVMLVRYDPERLENTLYAGHTRFLARVGVPVPRILFDDPRTCVTVLQDLGDASVETWVPDRPEREVRRLYERVLDGVLAFHEAGGRAARRQRLRMVPSFRPVLYRWERNYFAEHMLRQRQQRPAAEITRLKRELAGVAARLQRAPRVLVHRDLQSSNLLLQRGRPFFIDYQGMRYGPAVYDLASLLCDPYVELPEPLCRDLLDYYASRCRTPRLVRELFWYGVVQRLAQALGAYARLGSRAETRYFARYIPPALRMMARALRHVPGLPALRSWCAEAQGPARR